MVKLVAWVRVQNRTARRIVHLPVSPFKKEVLAVVKLITQERVQNRTFERNVDAPVPQIQAEVVESAGAHLCAHSVSFSTFRCNLSRNL